MELTFFKGDLRGSNVEETVLRRKVNHNTWHHVAMAVDAENLEVTLYVDGELEEKIQMAETALPVSCPQFFREVDVHLQEQGSMSIGGQPPQWLFRSVYDSGVYRIHRMDVETYTEDVVLGDGATSYRDPDYSAVLDRLVFVSNESGSDEVWIANGDGSDKTQVTVGFGKSNHGIKARAPKFAPDGSAIVFESNAHDILAMENRFQTYHLYYVAYNNRANVPEITLPNGAKTNQLKYDDLVASQTIRFFRLTDVNLNRNHTQPRWLRGNHRDLVCMDQNGTGCTEGVQGCHCRDGELRLGDLVYNSSSEKWDDYRVMSLMIGSDVLMTSREELTGLSSYSDEKKLVDVYHKVLLSGDAGITLKDQMRLLYETKRTIYEAWPVAEREFTVEAQACTWLSRDTAVADAGSSGTNGADSSDVDFDGIANSSDNCPQTYNPSQDDANGDNIGDACTYARCNMALTFRPIADMYEANCWDTDIDGVRDRMKILSKMVSMTSRIVIP